MADDFYSYPYPDHPAYSPPPDYTSPNPIDYTSATPSTPFTDPGVSSMGAPRVTPFAAHMLGDTAYGFLQSFLAWFNAIRPAHDEEKDRRA
jgi:hypothetical protein